MSGLFPPIFSTGWPDFGFALPTPASNHCQTSEKSLVPAVGQMDDRTIIRAALQNPPTYSSNVTCSAMAGNRCFLKMNLKYPFVFYPASKILQHSDPVLHHPFSQRLFLHAHSPHPPLTNTMLFFSNRTLKISKLIYFQQSYAGSDFKSEKAFGIVISSLQIPILPMYKHCRIYPLIWCYFFLQYQKLVRKLCLYCTTIHKEGQRKWWGGNILKM